MSDPIAINAEYDRYKVTAVQAEARRLEFEDACRSIERLQIEQTETMLSALKRRADAREAMHEVVHARDMMRRLRELHQCVIYDPDFID